jgi:hypothetical protein
MVSVHDLDLDLRTVGRAQKPIVVGETRELELEDLESLQVETATKPKPLKKLRNRHHQLAKMLADGVSEGDASIMCGYTNSHISILKADPSFKDLVTFYQEKVDDKYLDLHEKIAGLGEDAVDEITERLTNEPEEFSVGQLLEVSKMALDRSGYGPQTSTNVNVNIGLADKLAASRKRALQAKADAMKESRMIDITPEDEG